MSTFLWWIGGISLVVFLVIANHLGTDPDRLMSLDGPRSYEDTPFASMQLKRIADSLDIIAKNMGK